MNTLAEIEVKLRKGRRIIVPGYSHDPNMSVDDYIMLLITKLVRENETTGTRGGFQCRRNAHRSLGDLYKLTVFHYPDLTLKQFAYKLKTLVNEKKVETLYCWVIRKMTYFYEPNTTGNVYAHTTSRRLDEYKLAHDYGLKEEDL